MEVLEEHIMGNILQIGQRFYLQVVGIPQGSILSSLLCSVYYGHLERYHLASSLQLDNVIAKEIVLNPLAKSNGDRRSPSAPYSKCESILQSSSINLGDHTKEAAQKHIRRADRVMCSFSTQESARKVSHVQISNVKPKNILLRLVDDWLFISNCQNNTSHFVQRVHKGFADYNCVANKLKTAVSFDIPLSRSPLKMNVYRTEDGACFMRWSGLLINCHTLEIQADYTRYCGVDVQSTLTVWRKNNQGCYLMIKLCQFMRPKCHPLFYDLNINSPATVCLNAYQAFLLCAMKFHAYNCSLSCGGRSNQDFWFQAVQKTATYMHSLLLHRAEKLSTNTKVKPLFLLHANEVDWLALCAFRKVLLKKHSRYTRLLSLIERECQSHKYDGLSTTPFVVSALDDRRSSMFKYIIY